MVSRNTYDLVSGRRRRNCSSRRADFAQGRGAASIRAPAQIRATARQVCATRSRSRASLVKVYLPYIQELIYTFHCRNIRALYARHAAGRRRPPSVSRPRESTGAITGSTCICRGCAGTSSAARSAYSRRVRAARRHRTLIELLDSAAENFGAHPALVARISRPASSTSLSYRELRDRAARAALMLRNRGVKPGDRVLLIGENSPDWVMAFFSILYAGAVAVPLDQMISAEELARDLPDRATARRPALRRRVAGSPRPARRMPGEIIELRVRRTGPPLYVARQRADQGPISTARRWRRSSSPRAAPAHPRA